MKPQGVIPGKDNPPKDKNRRAVGRIIGVSLLPPLCGSNKWYWLPGVTPVGFTPGYYLITPTVFGDNYNAKKVWLIMSKNIAHGFEKHCSWFWKTLPVIFSNVAHGFSKHCQCLIEPRADSIVRPNQSFPNPINPLRPPSSPAQSKRPESDRPSADPPACLNASAS